MRAMVVTLGVSTLVAGTVGALTLDTSVTRNVPYLQRLLITSQ